MKIGLLWLPEAAGQLTGNHPNERKHCNYTTQYISSEQAQFKTFSDLM